MNTLTFFDIKTLYFSELMGDIWLGFFVGILIILFVSLKNKISGQVLLLLIGIWSLICYGLFISELKVLWILIISIAGLFFYLQMSKKISGG